MSVREFSFPFALARGALEKTSPNRIVLDKDPSYLSYLVLDGDCATREIYVEDDNQKSTLTVGVMLPSTYRLAVEMERTLMRIEKCMQPILEHHFGVSGILLGARCGKEVEAAYEISFSYDALDDEECVAYFNAALSCCGAGVQLATPVMAHSDFCNRPPSKKFCRDMITGSALMIFGADLSETDAQH